MLKKHVQLIQSVLNAFFFLHFKTLIFPPSNFSILETLVLTQIGTLLDIPIIQNIIVKNKKLIKYLKLTFFQYNIIYIY